MKISEYWKPEKSTHKVLLEFTPNRYEKFIKILNESGIEFPEHVANCITMGHMMEKGQQIKIS